MRNVVLSEDQQRVVMSNSAAIVVVAGAGSGKTEVVAHWIERLLHESEDEGYRILALSYTVKAAEEIRERLRERLGDLHRRVDADTIHGFALSLLREHGTRIGLPMEPEVLSRDEDRFELLSSWLNAGGETWPDDPSVVFQKLDLARARCDSAPLLTEWHEALAASGAVDFAAMLDRGSELLESAWLPRHLRRIYGHAVVDEAQNLTAAQYRFLTQIIGTASSDQLNAMLVGDERQSIVGFAGADRTLISRFQKEYNAERIEFKTNYRSAAAIIRAGRIVATHLGQPTDALAAVEFPAKGFVAFKRCPTELAEAAFVANWIQQLLADGLRAEFLAPGESRAVLPEEVAVLARSGASLRPMREALAEHGIQSASSSTEDDWVTSPTARAMIELIAHISAPDHVSTKRRLAAVCGSDDPEWSSVPSLIASSVDPDVKMVGLIADLADPGAMLHAAAAISPSDPNWPDDLAQIEEAWNSFLDRTNHAERTFGNFRQHIARCQRGDALQPSVRLLTVHKAQGKEFKVVALVACNEGQFPDFRARSADEVAAELRTFYVAISRASRALLITRAQQRQTRYGPRAVEPSRFAVMLHKDFAS